MARTRRASPGPRTPTSAIEVFGSAGLRRRGENRTTTEKKQARKDNDADVLTPDRTEAERFLGILDPIATEFTFQTFDDDPFAHIIHGTLDQCWDRLCRLNAEGAGIFVTINQTDFKGRSNENIARLRARFVDLDGAPIEPVLEHNPAPRIVVESSPGKFHAYWPTIDDSEMLALDSKEARSQWIETDNGAKFKAQQITLAERFGGDTSVNDLPRVMRLPGFFHRKATPFRSRIIHVNDVPPCKLTDLLPNLNQERNGHDPFGELGEESKSPTQRLNSLALANLAAWVLEIFPTARPYHDGFRVSSTDLGRGNEEDLSLVPEGIKDFGVHDLDDPREGKRTPVEVVMEYVFEVPIEEIAERTNTVEFQQAVDWLRERVGSEEPKSDADKKKKKEFIVTAKPHDFLEEALLERRDFVYGSHLLRGTVSLSAGTGAVGKSSKSIVEALAMATGKPLLDVSPRAPLRVLLINLEDNRREMNRRIAAAMKHYSLTEKDVGDRLISIAKGELKLKLAKQVRMGEIARDEKVINGLIDYLRKNSIDVVSIDPLRKTHRVNENDNVAMGEVIECYEDIAEMANCAVHLWHHNRKGNSGEITIDSARGASSIIDAPRSAEILETMPEGTAEKFDIEPSRRRYYFRTFNGKINFAPPIEESIGSSYST
jgi:hypothetical protein